MWVWNEQGTERVTELWISGRTADAIATEVGGGLTRAAVLGKVMRLGLKRDGSLLQRVRVRADSPPRPERVPDGALELMQQVPDLEPLVRFVDLADDQCRWMPGEPAYDAPCCGRQQVVGKPYCHDHVMRAAGPRKLSVPGRVNAGIRVDRMRLAAVDDFQEA